MSQIAATLEISRDIFMIPMQEGQILIHKDDIVSCQYFDIHKDVLKQREMDNLNQFINDLSSGDRVKFENYISHDYVVDGQSGQPNIWVIF